MDSVPGWWCEHHDEITIGKKLEHRKAYCSYNRNCVTCKAVLVPEYEARTLPGWIDMYEE